MPFRCDSCGKTSREAPQITVTGRHLCPTCKDELTGAAAGMMAGGGVPGAIATAGVFGALRNGRRRLASRSWSPGRRGH